MARATSTISVAITGDSKKLQGALRGADKSVKGFGSSIKGAAVGIGAALAGVFAISKGFEFIQGALEQADRLGDSIANLNRIIGKVNTAKLRKVAGSFIDLGLSSADVLELSVGFARIGRTIGISQHIIGRYADDVAAVAQALSLVDENGRDAAAWVAIIGKVAAKPSLKNAKELGLSLTKIEKLTTALAVKETGKLAKDLTDADKAAARLKVILKLLGPVVKDALANPDVELKQKIIKAKIEELQGQLGEGLAPIVADILQNVVDISKSEWVDDMVKGIEVLQGKHDVPIFEDLKKGIDTADATFKVVNEEWSSDIKELQDAFTVQLPAGIKVASDALGPYVTAIVGLGTTVGNTVNDIEDTFVGWGVTVGNTVNDIEDNFAGLLGNIIGFVTDAKGVLGGLVDLMNQIFTHHEATFSVNGSGGLRARQPGARQMSDADIAAAQRRENERNGLGRNK